MEDKFIAKEEAIKLLRAIIGEGTNIKSGTKQAYKKGDVMKYESEEGRMYLYRCKKDGEYSIPDKDNFKKIDLRGGK